MIINTTPGKSRIRQYYCHCMKDIGHSSPVLNIDFFTDASRKAAEIFTIGYIARESMERCGWVSQDPLYIAYHDNEWGVPETDRLNLQSKCNKKRSTHQLEYNFVSTQK
ncbi:DNA-3-methyladenine glycosylase I, partial [Escherichia coli]|uniref:DNA-3-methyladenine glycosylase I n=1 Tax=Escherichia coli TaxID=562 RepID=UPI003CFB4B71